MNSPTRPANRPHWILLALPGLIVALVHGPTLSNFLYTHDGWNDVQLGENILDGQLPLHENLLRIIPTLSFALRALFGLEMWAWHLPNVLLHMLNTYLVAWLTLQLSQRYRAAAVAAMLFASAPLLSHPVEWIGGGYDLFATAGVLLAVSGTLTKKHWLTVGGTLLALLSKELEWSQQGSHSAHWPRHGGYRRPEVSGSITYDGSPVSLPSALSVFASRKRR